MFRDHLYFDKLCWMQNNNNVYFIILLFPITNKLIGKWLFAKTSE